MNSTRDGLTDRERKIKDRYVERVGRWPAGFEEWLRLDEDSFEAYAEFAAHPYETDHIDRKDKALVRLAITASPTHMYAGGTREHVVNALEEGATVEEIKEILELVSVLGVHAAVEGMPVVREKLGTPARDDPDDAERMEATRELFRDNRGYWNEFWEGVLRQDPAFLEKFAILSGYPWNHGTLDPKLKEFVYIAIDASATHLFTTGMEQHVENAIRYGATRAELVELIELVCEQGYDAMIEAMPVLAEAATERANR